MVSRKKYFKIAKYIFLNNIINYMNYNIITIKKHYSMRTVWKLLWKKNFNYMLWWLILLKNMIHRASMLVYAQHKVVWKIIDCVENNHNKCLCKSFAIILGGSMLFWRFFMKSEDYMKILNGNLNFSAQNLSHMLF